MASLAPQDGRGFFVLPQSYEGIGYYTYGRPGGGVAQYAHPHTLTVLFQIASTWSGIDKRRFGIGDISLANGVVHRPHRSHRSGLEVDIRAIRKDGRRQPCNWRSQDYDRDATAKLIALFVRHPSVKRVLFNDKSITGVRPAPRHDDHFHVEFRGA
jgi:murein endopeptidase